MEGEECMQGCVQLGVGGGGEGAGQVKGGVRGTGAHLDCPLVPSRLVERFGNF